MVSPNSLEDAKVKDLCEVGSFLQTLVYRVNQKNVNKFGKE